MLKLKNRQRCSVKQHQGSIVLGDLASCQPALESQERNQISHRKLVEPLNGFETGKRQVRQLRSLGGLECGFGQLLELGMFENISQYLEKDNLTISGRNESRIIYLAVK